MQKEELIYKILEFRKDITHSYLSNFSIKTLNSILTVETLRVEEQVADQEALALL